MNKHIYGKLALTNLKKNPKLYVPYLLTLIGCMLFYYILTSLGNNPLIYNASTGKAAFKAADILCPILQSGSFVAAFFAFIFLLYANSFVLKHQKKQLGLYRVLGMERKHLIRIIFLETFLMFAGGLIGAIFLGFLFDKLMLMLLFRIIHQPMPKGFFLNTTATYHTVTLSLLLAALILLRSIFSLLRTRDIDLLKSEKQGEKEPKNRLFLALIGLIFLVIGYYTALSSHGSSEAISNFFPAAICVIIGTYALFTAGSIAILKLLKQNKNYYYTTRHFISLSGMLYRMKQNAAGLATICILSTAAIVVLSAGMCLYTSGTRSISEQFPRSVQIRSEYESELSVHNTEMNIIPDTLQDILNETAKENSISYQNLIYCNCSNGVFDLEGNELLPKTTLSYANIESIPDTYILTLEEYNRFNNASETLKENEILLYGSDKIFEYDTLIFDGATYQIKGSADHDCLTYIADYSMSLFSKLLIIVPNKETLLKFMPENYSFCGSYVYLGFDVNTSSDKVKNFTTELSKALNAQNIEHEITLKSDEEGLFYGTYGGLFFVGILLGILFLICTVMIIYYKQISEGYNDRERFLIMQKIGLSKREIKQSIHSQVMLLFFLPLITAIIHSAVALNIVADCLRLVLIVHIPTFIASVAITCVLFSICYGIVYKITSKEYYLIVNE